MKKLLPLLSTIALCLILALSFCALSSCKKPGGHVSSGSNDIIDNSDSNGEPSGGEQGGPSDGEQITPIEYLNFILNPDGESYSVSNINAYPNTPADIVIPSTYNSKPVTSIGGWAFWNCSGFSSVSIPDSIASIKAV